MPYVDDYIVLICSICQCDRFVAAEEKGKAAVHLLEVAVRYIVGNRLDFVAVSCTGLMIKWAEELDCMVAVAVVTAHISQSLPVHSR